jgi:hypothetical protein
MDNDPLAAAAADQTGDIVLNLIAAERQKAPLWTRKLTSSPITRSTISSSASTSNEKASQTYLKFPD